jgi:hypothetical protein
MSRRRPREEGRFSTFSGRENCAWNDWCEVELWTGETNYVLFFTVYIRTLPVLFSRILQFEFLHKRGLNPCTNITKAAVQILRNNNTQRINLKLAITVPVIRITEQYWSVPFHIGTIWNLKGTRFNTVQYTVWEWMFAHLSVHHDGPW